MGFFDELGKNALSIGGVDLNPFRSSIYTGKGTPWGEGPQDPYKATYKPFNAADYQGFDTSGLGKALRQEIGQTSARAKGRLQGALQRAGGGGADAISGLAQLEGEQGTQENILNAKLAQQDYETRWRQYLAQMEQERARESQDMARYQMESEGRAAPMQFLGNVAGTALGGAAGGLGGALAKKWFG